MVGLTDIVDLKEALVENRFGGKASRLATLTHLFKIPPGFVISGDCFTACGGRLTDELRIAILNYMHDYMRRHPHVDQEWLWAVRSSAIGEDGADLSYAGQLKSFLNIALEEVPDTVARVWDSARSEHIQLYQTHHHQHNNTPIHPLVPAVFIQAMIQPVCAGVAFSVDPVTANPNICVINATQGLADQLVSGEINAELYYLNRSGEIQKQTGRILSAKQAASIIQLLLDIEAYFKQPQDIEWAIGSDHQLYLLQARPITTLKAFSAPKKTAYADPSATQSTLWDNSNIVESYSGVTSPLTFSFARTVYEHVYLVFCELMWVPKASIQAERVSFKNMLGFVRGHVYYNLLSWYRILALFPGFKMNRAFMEKMMGVREPLPEKFLFDIVKDSKNIEKIKDCFLMMRTVLGLLWQQMRLPKTITLFNRRLESALKDPDHTLDLLSEAALCQSYRKLEADLLNDWDAPLINDFFCMILFGLSRDLLQKYAGDAGVFFHSDRMIGQGDMISAEPAKRIRELAEIAARDPKLIECLLKQTGFEHNPHFEQKLESYLDTFGDRCLQELKLESLTLRDDPTTLFFSIATLAQRISEEGAHVKTTDLSKTKNLSLKAILPRRLFKRWLIERLLASAKKRVTDRENLRFARTRVFGRVRRIIVAIGRKWEERGLLKQYRDIFFLEIQEILGAIEGTGTCVEKESIQGLVQLRQSEHRHFIQEAPPPQRFEIQGTVVDGQRVVIEKHQATVPHNTHQLTGLGCCAGVVKAFVRVITDPRGAILYPGEILVAEFTDPGWITLFANAAGIIVARGSLLSHSAIVAREMSIPAIVGVADVMQRLKTGMRVEMNGSTGVIQCL